MFFLILYLEISLDFLFLPSYLWLSACLMFLSGLSTILSHFQESLIAIQLAEICLSLFLTLPERFFLRQNCLFLCLQYNLELMGNFLYDNLFSSLYFFFFQLEFFTLLFALYLSLCFFSLWWSYVSLPSFSHILLNFYFFLKEQPNWPTGFILSLTPTITQFVMFEVVFHTFVFLKFS